MYSQLGLPTSIVIYCNTNTWTFTWIQRKGVTRVGDNILLQEVVNTTDTLEIPLDSVGLLLRLLS